ncbi:hypothetical protein Tco_1330104 [Tanacetum coccineum]
MARDLSNVTEVRSFLGLAGYLPERFVEGFLFSRFSVTILPSYEKGILHDLERLDVNLCVRGSAGYWRVDDGSVVWYEDRLCVPNDQTLREKTELGELVLSSWDEYLAMVSSLPTITIGMLATRQQPLRAFICELEKEKERLIEGAENFIRGNSYNTDMKRGLDRRKTGRRIL